MRIRAAVVLIGGAGGPMDYLLYLLLNTRPPAPAPQLNARPPTPPARAQGNANLPIGNKMAEV